MPSTATDVAEMRELCGEIADRTAESDAWKDRTDAVAAGVKVGWNRAYEFLKGKVRQVQSWEKDNARQRVAELRRAEREQEDRAHFLWLREQIDRHRASGEELRGPHVDALEHFLRSTRGEAGSVAVQSETASEGD